MSRMSKSGLTPKVYAVLIASVILLFSITYILAQDRYDHEVNSDHNEQVEHDDHNDESGHDEQIEHDDHDDESSHDEQSEGDAHDEHDDHEDEGVLELSAEAMEMAGIKMSRVTRGRIGKSMELPGEVGFDEDRLIHIAPRFEGIAREAKFRVGDYVRKGDIMAVIESNESMSTYNIEAPISGWIIERHITTGEYVSGENSIYVLADLSKVWVNLAVYPKDADFIKAGLKVRVKAIGQDLQAEGIIDYLTPILDINTRSLTARVILPNPENRWRPGTFVQADVITDYGKEGLLINKDAVQTIDDEKVVFISEGQKRFRSVVVATGEYDSQSVEILSGLEEGMEYVSDGAFELKAKIVTSNLGSHAGHGH